MHMSSPKPSSSDPLSRLDATQAREMRESFQVLDRDDDGQVTREDVADILGQLGACAAHLVPKLPC